MVSLPCKQIDQMETNGENNQNFHECLLCDAKFIEKSQLKDHLERHVKGGHEGKMPFDCEIGNKEYPDKNTLKDRRKVCTEEKKLSFQEKPFKCDNCNYQCSKTDVMSRHVLTHTRLKPFKCHICEFNFSLKALLKRHIASVHEGKKPFKCNICDFKSSRKDDLIIHVSIHTGVKRFQCDICEYKSSLKSILNKHVASVHEGKKSFKCNACDWF